MYISLFLPFKSIVMDLVGPRMCVNSIYYFMHYMLSALLSGLQKSGLPHIKFYYNYFLLQYRIYCSIEQVIKAEVTQSIFIICCTERCKIIFMKVTLRT